MSVGAETTAGSDELQRLYSRRFAGRTEYRDRVWQLLNRNYFAKWINGADSVLDLGSGYGEFINNVGVQHRHAMDLNPDAGARLDEDVTFHLHDCSTAWPTAECSIGVVFTSNFLEHLRTKIDLSSCLSEAHRTLRPGGMFIAMGPNIRLAGGAYWDFFDHYLPLTERSISEALQLVGFEVELSRAAFMPYTMSEGRHFPLWMLRLYLRLPFVWRFFGKQFVVVARKARSTPG